jgi:hypothetical protein
MKDKWLLKVFGIVTLLLLAILGLVYDNSIVSAQQSTDKIEGLLLDQFATRGSSDFIMHFDEQADLSAAYSMDWNTRGEFVYNALKETAELSQANAKVLLDANGQKYQTFIAGNELYVWGGNLTLANELVVLPNVDFIRATRTYHIDPVEDVKPLENLTWAGAFLATHTLTTVGSSTEAITAWGITDTKADQFWTTYGVRGDGIVVANIDTGVQWNHPALDQSFKCGLNPSDPVCWYDPANICGASGACDNNGHGTHTMGTMVADDDPSLTYIAGMAPNAHWIACKGCESNECSDFALNACSDWILAPNGNPINRPNVVNNSWGGDSGGDNWFQAKVQAWRAAGIFPAFSAGNSGPGCSTLASPGDYQESFASAAHDSGHNIGSFSSRGPSAFGDNPYTKPNLSAPGVSICSTVPTNAWSCGYSGTSMASPHTAGAVALLWSCNPDLIGAIDITFQALQNSVDTPPAGDCGAPADGQGNYTYGYGYLDVLAAGNDVCNHVDTGFLIGHVYDENNKPIEGASVTASPAVLGNGINATTDPTGSYSMELLVGTYDITASKNSYTSQTVTGVQVLSGQTKVQDFQLTYIGAWTKIALPTGCPDWTRYDGEYYAGTGNVYFLGGRTVSGSDTTYGDIYSFDPITDICIDTGANMPTPISNYTIVKINLAGDPLLCTFGGRDNAGGYIAAVQCYNPITNTTSTASTLPGEMGEYIPGGVAVVSNKVYVFGGYRSTDPYHIMQTWEWDPETNTWAQKGDISLGRGYINVSVVDGKIYGFGGDIYNGTDLLAQTKAEVFDPVTGKWNDAAVADLPTASGEGTAYGFDSSSPYELGGKIIIAGGGQWPNDTAETFLYDIATKTYDYTFADLNVSRRDQAGFFVPGDPGAMWVFGGRSSSPGFGSDNPPYAPPEYYPVHTFVPDILVTTPPLNVILPPDSVLTMNFTIMNQGVVALDWLLTESTGTNINNNSTPFIPEAKTGGSANIDLTLQSPDNSVIVSQDESQSPDAALWDQPLSSFITVTYTVADQAFPDAPSYSSFLTDDFTNSVPWAITKIFVPGSGGNGFTSLLNATQLTWQLYFNSAGFPDGDPSVGGIPPVWNLTLPPIDPQVTITSGSGGKPSDVTLTLASPLVLPPGTYWLVFYPTMNFAPYGQYGRQPSDTSNGSMGKFINPGGAFGFGTAWQDWTVISPTLTDIAFRLEGSAALDVTWLSENPISGTISPGKTQNVAVTFDSAGLTENIYKASLVIRSNDPDQPIISIPVLLGSGKIYLPITYKH